MTTTTQIAEYSATEAALATLREKYAAAVFDVSTTKGMQDARAARRELTTYRTSLEAKRKELKAPVLERGRLLDSEAKRITAELLKLEEPIDAVIKAEEARRAEEKRQAEEAEQARLAAIQERINTIRSTAVLLAGASAEQIAAQQVELGTLEITLEEFGELTGEAMQARTQTLEQLAELHAAALRIEAEREELEQLRAQQAEAEAKAKAEQERIAAEQAAQQAELDRQRQELEQQQAAAAKAEQDKRDAEAKAERELTERKLYETFLQEGPPAEELVRFIAEEYQVDHADAARWLASHDFAALAEQIKAA